MQLYSVLKVIVTVKFRNQCSVRFDRRRPSSPGFANQNNQNLETKLRKSSKSKYAKSQRNNQKHTKLNSRIHEISGSLRRFCCLAPSPWNTARTKLKNYLLGIPVVQQRSTTNTTKTGIKLHFAPE